MPKLPHLPGPAAFAIKSLILYDDFALATKVNNALQRAVSHSDLSVQWNIKLWRTDILQLQPATEAALLDAIDAHLIVFALKPTTSISTRLLDWLKQWARQRQIHDVALAVASQENSETLSAAMCPELSYFADCHGLSFICDDQSRRKNRLALLTTYLSESKPLASALSP